MKSTDLLRNPQLIQKSVDSNLKSVDSDFEIHGFHQNPWISSTKNTSASGLSSSMVFRRKAQ